MMNQARKWELLSKKKVLTAGDLVSLLLKNRGIGTEKKKKEFLNPQNPLKISLKKAKINEAAVKECITRIKKAKKDKEQVFIYGDYDADGVTATAILWETLHEIGLNVLPFIPDRFEDGYGIKAESVNKLKSRYKDLSLIVTVDNGIVAYEGIKEAKKLGIDVIVVDHHQKGTKSLVTQFVIHNTEVCGSTLTWFFARELTKAFKQDIGKIESRLELAAIGTIADQLPLKGINRSVVKYGLIKLNKTKRPGLLGLYKEARVSEIGPYEVGFVVAPRINSMGRLENGLDALRLLCTTDRVRAERLARKVGLTNSQRQKIVDEVVTHALKKGLKETSQVIVLANEKYHEGVIGLAASKLVEKFGKPAIVISKNKEVSKASARSVEGFNIIETIRKLEDLYIEGGGHQMAAGFSIKTKNIKVFTGKINKLSKKLLTEDILQKKIKIDCQIDFKVVNKHLLDKISLLEPMGLGNPQPTFLTKCVDILGLRPVGRDLKHLKLKLKQNDQVLDSIFFGGGEIYPELKSGIKINVVYNIEENIWNGYKNLQLKVKDLKF